jgi:hypothetical protein
MSHKITPLETNKQTKQRKKSAHKATQTVEDKLQPMNIA